MKTLSRLLCILVLAGCTSEAPKGTFTQTETGVVVTPADGAARRVRLEVRTDRIVRVTSVTDANLDLPASLMVVSAAAKPPAFTVDKTESEIVLKTAQVAAHVSLANGAVSFTDLAGKPLLAEEPFRKTEPASLNASTPVPTKPSTAPVSIRTRR